mmetsp:Transcript_39012/g.74734  ORF Transcript_39012/g.74734 Transcript_39012/m.74734 type:complete len:447 (-) Transcript_39012:116-1456(-)
MRVLVGGAVELPHKRLLGELRGEERPVGHGAVQHHPGPLALVHLLARLHRLHRLQQRARALQNLGPQICPVHWRDAHKSVSVPLDAAHLVLVPEHVHHLGHHPREGNGLYHDGAVALPQWRLVPQSLLVDGNADQHYNGVGRVEHVHHLSLDLAEQLVVHGTHHPGGDVGNLRALRDLAVLSVLSYHCRPPGVQVRHQLVYGLDRRRGGRLLSERVEQLHLLLACQAAMGGVVVARLQPRCVRSGCEEGAGRGRRAWQHLGNINLQGGAPAFSSVLVRHLQLHHVALVVEPAGFLQQAPRHLALRQASLQTVHHKLGLDFGQHHEQVVLAQRVALGWQLRRGGHAVHVARNREAPGLPDVVKAGELADTLAADLSTPHLRRHVAEHLHGALDDEEGVQRHLALLEQRLARDKVHGHQHVQHLLHVHEGHPLKHGNAAEEIHLPLHL